MNTIKTKRFMGNPWQDKYDIEYAKEVDNVIGKLGYARSDSALKDDDQVCALTKKDCKILCKEIARAMTYLAGRNMSIYSLKCNVPEDGRRIVDYGQLFQSYKDIFAGGVVEEPLMSEDI